MVGTTIRATWSREKQYACCLPLLFFALIVVFIVLPRLGHPSHKGPVGGWSPEGHCCWPDFKTPFSFSLEDRESH